MINTAHLRQIAALNVVEKLIPPQAEPAEDRANQEAQRAEACQLAADFRRLCESLPARIYSNGIVRVIAYLANSANNPERKTALDALTEWATSNDAPIAWPPVCTEPTLRGRLANSAAGHSTLRDCQKESLRFAEWLKHWAQALLPKRED